MAVRQNARTPPPRQLQSNESLESLTHWRTTFRTFYKKDDTYKVFFQPNMQWDPSQNEYGLLDETHGLKREANELCEDLLDLLNTLAGYLPHSYLTEKIVGSTKNWEDVFSIIHDHYNVKVSSESMMDFEMLFKTAEETHRQFYERLLQHTRKHLAPANVKVENYTNTAADTMSISLMNMVALQWLRKTNPALLKIVRTEYSTELRANTQLADLVPRIAPNIDSLLQRYEQGASTHKVNIEDSDIKAVDTAAINKTWGWKSSRGRGKYSQGSDRGGTQTFRNNPRQNAGTGPFCPGCFYLAQQLGTQIHFRHSTANCPRRNVTVKMLQMEDEEHFSCDGTAQEDIETSGKKTNFAHNEGFECLQHFQTMNENESRYGNDCHDEIRSILLPKTNLVEKDAKLYSNTECPNDSPNIISDIDETNFQDSLINQIRRLEDRKPLWINTGVRKSTSPCILARLGKAPVYMTIDEGSEVNCIDESFAARNAVTFVPTKCRATAAGSTNMILAGQTKEDIVLTFDHNKEKVILFVGKMIVVKNLGVNILLGEPGKRDNAIVTIPHERMVEFSSDKGKRIRVPYTSSQENIPATEVFHCKALKNDTIYSDHTLTIQLPIHMRKNKCVVLTNKNTSQYPGIKSKILPVNNGMVSIKNESAAPIKLSKHEHFADIHTCSNISFHNEIDKINKVYCLDREDFSHLVPFETKESLETQDYTNEIVIDPDKILPEHWRNRFMTICREYADIITPKPGKYNGFYGLVDNSINFSNIPPPSVRAHLPKYSHEMLVIMGEKMDQLERWGVLRKPEDLGIVPEFVLASMLQPKPDSGDWRLVTDFTPLNISDYK